MPQNDPNNSNEYPIPPKEPVVTPPNPLVGVQPFVNPNSPQSTNAVPPQAPDTPKPAENHPQVTPQSNNIPQIAEKKRKAREKLKKIKQHRHFGTVRFAVISFLVFLLVFNFQLIYSQVLFFFTPKEVSTTQQQPTTPTQPTQTTTTAQPQPAEVVGPENVLIIPKINVRVPIIFTNTLNETEILKSLENGVVHYAGTANPGENGNSVFFGHSSNDWWEPGNYKFVFVLLEKMVPGDTYEVHYQSRKYVYKITQTKIVAPNDLSVLAQTPNPTSTLITCTPPGTSWRRFIVYAEQIEPVPNAAPVQQASNTPATNQTSVDSTKSGVLPSASPSIFSQIQAQIAGFFGRFFGGPNNTQPDSQPQNSPTNNHLPEVSLEKKLTLF